MAYIDLLDSIKSAHPISSTADWWRINNKDDQLDAVSLGQTELMLRILHGETIKVSNNQAFDSFSFLSSIPNLVRFNFLERPVMAFSYFKNTTGSLVYDAITPEVLLDASISYLNNENFVFSAWRGMDNILKLRPRMVDAIKRSSESTKFVNMVNIVSKDIDSAYIDEYRTQASWLQQFYNYLRELDVQGKKVILSAVASNRKIWDSLDRLKYISKEVQPIAIENLANKLISNRQWEKREDRSVLYRQIEDFGPGLRDLLKKYIDIYYNEKIGSSVSPNGRGTYSIIDHNPKTSPSNEEQTLEDSEADLSLDGIVGEEALEIYPENRTTLDSLTWDDVYQAMYGDEALRRSAYRLQDKLSTFRYLDPEDPEYQTKVVNWKNETNDILESHQTYLASVFAKKISYESKGRNLFSLVAPKVGLISAVGIGTAVGAYVAVATANPILGTATGTLTAKALEKFFKTVTTWVEKSGFESSAVIRVREDLRKLVRMPKDSE